MKRSIHMALLIALSLPLATLTVRGQGEANPPARNASRIQSLSIDESGARQRSNRLEKRTSQLICTLSAFFSVDADQIVGPTTRLDGRGLANCTNDQGFQTEVPIQAEIELSFPTRGPKVGEIAISANSSPFVVPRELSQLQDTYALHPATAGLGNPELSFLVRGEHHDLLIELKLISRTATLKGVRLHNLKLTFDESAPDLF